MRKNVYMLSLLMLMVRIWFLWDRKMRMMVRVCRLLSFLMYLILCMEVFGY